MSISAAYLQGTSCSHDAPTAVCITAVSHIGLALTPAPIAKDFWANEEMGDLLLDSVICVVDSRNILKVNESLLF